MHPVEIRPVEGLWPGVNGYRCSSDPASFPICAWLEMGLADHGARGAAERLFEGLRAFKAGERRSVTVSPDPTWVVRVDASGASVHYMPTIGEPFPLSVDELTDLVLRWNDAVCPSLAARLRGILDGSAPSRVPNAATRILAAALDVEEPDGPTIARALGIPLALERRSDPMEYYKCRFDEGPYQAADFRHNTQTGMSILVLPPRRLSFDDLDFDALGGEPEFRGFEFTPEARESYVLALGRLTLRLGCERGRGELQAVAVHWGAR